MVDFLRFSSKFRQNRQFRILEKRRERSYTPGDVEYTQGLPMKKKCIQQKPTEGLQKST